MSDTQNAVQPANTTNVVGYFNPQKYPISIEISDLNIKAELAPAAYIRDRKGNYINDPIFEAYCHAKGLARATSQTPVTINYVPRMVKSERTTSVAVTQATGFVREKGGRTVPTFSTPPAPTRESPVNKRPHAGMSMETARKLGLVGKSQRLVDEDYGVDDTPGAPPKMNQVPRMKYSMESAPKIKASSSLMPELTQADESLSAQERTQREQLQNQLRSASASTSPEDLNPAAIRPGVISQPAALPPPNLEESSPSPTPAPTPAPPQPSVQTPPPARTTTRSKTKAIPVKPARVTPAPAPAPQRVQPVRKQAAPVAPPPPPPQPDEPVQEDPSGEQAEEIITDEQELQPDPDQPGEEPGSGVIQPLDEAAESPVLESAASEDGEKRFICAADGKGFKFRSELERHVKRNFPASMHASLMSAYPPS